MSQSRKKAIMGNVQRQRRNRAITTVVVVGIVIVVIVGALAFWPRSSNAVPLPGYLDKCFAGNFYHSHPTLTLNINGSNLPIPANTGIQGGCNKPMHTHPGEPTTIHVESDEDRDYTVGDFFLIWGNWANDPKLAVFNSNQLFGGKVDATHTLSVTVNGSSNSDFQNLKFPRNAAESGGVCTPAPGQNGPCSPFDVVITYT